MKFNFSMLSSLSVITLCLSIIGCSDNPSVDGNNEGTQVYDENSHESIEPNPVADKKVLKQGFDPSLYHDVNKEADSNYLTYLALAQYHIEISDKERLDIAAYPDYLNELDYAKKEAMAKELIPQLHAEMAKYEQPYRVKVDLIPRQDRYDYEQEQAEKGLMDIHIELGNGLSGKYDFETKSFPISLIVQDSDESPCWFPFFVPDYNVQVHETSIVPNEACSLEVQDVVEDISKRNVMAKGIGYYRFEDRVAYPERVDLTFFDLDTGEDLATKTFTWSY